MNLLETIDSQLSELVCEHNIPIYDDKRKGCRICRSFKILQEEQSKIKKIKKQEIAANMKSIRKEKNLKIKPEYL